MSKVYTGSVICPLIIIIEWIDCPLAAGLTTVTLVNFPDFVSTLMMSHGPTPIDQLNCCQKYWVFLSTNGPLILFWGKKPGIGD